MSLSAANLSTAKLQKSPGWWRLLSQPWPTPTDEPWRWSTLRWSLGKQEHSAPPIGSGTPHHQGSGTGYRGVPSGEWDRAWAAGHASGADRTTSPTFSTGGQSEGDGGGSCNGYWRRLSRRRPNSKRVALSAEVLICRGTVHKVTSNRQPLTQQRRETREVRRRRKLPCGLIKRF